MSVLCIGNIDIRDFEKYRNVDTWKTPHGPSLNMEDATGYAEDRQKSSKVSLCFIDSWSSNFLPWNHLKVGIPPMLMPPWKKIRQELSETDFIVVEGLTEEESEKIANPA